MPKEKVELVDGSEVELTCRYLLPRKAYSLARQVLKITNMKETSDGQQQEMSGDFSGIVELIPMCVDEIVADCPQKDKISVKSMKQLYEKYAEKTIGEVMTSVSPKFAEK